MGAVHHQMPRPTVLEATLRKITETLANELACPTPSTPTAPGAASMQSSSGLLGDTLARDHPPRAYTMLAVRMELGQAPQ